MLESFLKYFRSLRVFDVLVHSGFVQVGAVQENIYLLKRTSSNIYFIQTSMEHTVIL